MCEYCEDGKPILDAYDEFRATEVHVAGSTIEVSWAGAYGEYVTACADINCCPMCGRDLREDAS